MEFKFTDARLELYECDNIIEIKYFKGIDSEKYRSWKLPLYILEELKDWWLDRKTYPMKERRNKCEFQMETFDYLYIREYTEQGALNVIGWHFPTFIIKAVLEMRNHNIQTKVIKIIK